MNIHLDVAQTDLDAALGNLHARETSLAAVSRVRDELSTRVRQQVCANERRVQTSSPSCVNTHTTFHADSFLQNAVLAMDQLSMFLHFNMAKMGWIRPNNKARSHTAWRGQAS